MTSSIYQRDPKGSEGSFNLYIRRKRKGNNFNKFCFLCELTTDEQVDQKVTELLDAYDAEDKPIEVNVKWCPKGTRMAEKFFA